MHMLNPHAARARLANRTQKRVYYSPGPLYALHVDGHDKLKAYGFPIWGALDGDSRNLRILTAVPENKNGASLLPYLLDVYERDGMAYARLISDPGVENQLPSEAQIFLRMGQDDARAGHKSVTRGESAVINCRIERFWLDLRHTVPGCL